MKNFVVAVSLLSAGFMSTASAEPKDYVARLNDDGLFCAKVQVQLVGRGYINKTKCRTLDEWREAGYIVNTKEVAEVE